MDNPLNVNTATIFFRTTPSIRERLIVQKKRLGIDLIDIVREGTLIRLEQLEDEERRAIETKRARAMQNVITTLEPARIHEWGAPKAVRRPEVALKEILGQMPSEKVRVSFRKWAEYVEGAEDRIERKAYLKEVHSEIKERLANEENPKAAIIECERAFDAFDDFLKSRESSKKKPGVVQAVGVVEGDLK